MKEAGFCVSQICCSRPSCFDFAAQKGNRAALIKVCSEVDAFSPQDYRELKIVADHMSAAPLVVGQRSHETVLADDTVYSRYSVNVVTARTLKNVAARTAYPLIYAGPGGYTVEIDGKLVEQRRKELGWSVGKLAAMVGVSRRTLYGYERGMTRASVSSAYNLAKSLGIPIAKPIDILDRGKKEVFPFSPQNIRLLRGNPVLNKIIEKLCCCEVSSIIRAPFDFVANAPDKRQVILGSVASDNEKHLDRRVEETLSLCKVVGAYPLLVTDRFESENKDILCVHPDDLPEIPFGEDLVSMF